MKDFEVLKGYTLTREEADACEELIKKMRAERSHQVLIESVKNRLGKDIAAAINMIGLDDAKRVLRELNRELRSFSEDDDTPFD